ncbi:MAG: pyridoxal phosphate-dependent aminotransferase [Spirochaetaceae bacterium]
MYKLPLSERNSTVQESPIRKLAPYAEEAKRQGVHVFHLNIGQPDIATPEAMRKAYSEVPDVVAYGPSNGLPEFREALASYYRGWGVDIDSEQLLVTNGGSEAIIFALMAVTSPGDEIIIPEPYYANYNSFAAMVGAKIVPVATSLETGFHLPGIEEFEAKITEKTRAVLFSNPGNPTGAVFSRKGLEELADLAKRKGLYLISDEVYREFTYEGAEAIPLLTFPGLEEHAITVDSISKRYSACGARIGALVTRNERIRKLVLRFAQARLCPPTIDQIAAVAAINSPQGYLEEVAEEYRLRRETAIAGLADMKGVTYSRPEGAFYQIVELPVPDAEEFALWLLRDFRKAGETIMVAPAQGFYGTEGLGLKQIRVAYVLNASKMRRAFDILTAGVEDYSEVMSLPLGG